MTELVQIYECGSFIDAMKLVKKAKKMKKYLPLLLMGPKILIIKTGYLPNLVTISSTSLRFSSSSFFHVNSISSVLLTMVIHHFSGPRVRVTALVRRPAMARLRAISRSRVVHRCPAYQCLPTLSIRATEAVIVKTQIPIQTTIRTQILIITPIPTVITITIITTICMEILGTGIKLFVAFAQNKTKTNHLPINHPTNSLLFCNSSSVSLFSLLNNSFVCLTSLNKPCTIIGNHKKNDPVYFVQRKSY